MLQDGAVEGLVLQDGAVEGFSVAGWGGRRFSEHFRSYLLGFIWEKI